jgi:anti-sigma factor RsiW
MKGHVTEWLGAYLDGELRGLRLLMVESHLTECPVCQGEVHALRALQSLLGESPAAQTVTTPSRFVAQVGLRLPRRQQQPPAQRALELSWRMVPVGLLFALAFVQTVFMMAALLQAALSLGVGGDVAATLFPSSAGGVPLENVFTLSQASLVDASRVVVGLAESGTALAWLPVVYLLLVVVIGILYWSWLASWWVRRRHQQLTASKGLR